MSEVRGYLFPEVGALARYRGDGVILVDARSGWSSTATGEIAAHLRELFEDGHPNQRLQGLADAVPAVATAIRWATGQSVPLSASGALTLGGFGTLFVELVGRCNERCVHCYASASPDIGDHLSFAEVESILADAASLGFERVQFTGGDPLLCKFLPEAVSQAKALGIATREIYTNGLALSQRLLDALLPGEPCFAFSFYSHRAEVHDAITQTPGSQERTLDAIRRVLDAGCSARAAVVVTPENAADVEGTVAVLENAGVDLVSVSSTFEVGRGELFTAETRSSSSPLVGSHSGTTRTSGKLCVTYTGDVVPCIFARDRRLGSIRDRSLREIAESPTRRVNLETTEQLLKRIGRELSCTGCRLTTTALHLEGGRD